MESCPKNGMRDLRIDVVKGLCICLMVFGHLTHIGSCSSKLLEIVKVIYSVHMPVFIILTGYLFGKRQGTVDEGKRVVSRMLKPYLVMAPIAIFLYQVAAHFGIQTTNQVKEIGFTPYIGVLTGHVGGALWYLYTFGIVELLTLLALWWKPTRACGEKEGASIRIIVFVGACCCILAKLGFGISSYKIFYFFIGFFLRRTQVSLPCSACFFGSAALLFGVVGVSEYFTLGNCTWVLSVLGVLMWLAKGILSIKWLSKVLIYCGEHTLSILLFHNLISVALRPLSAKLLVIDPSGIAISFLMTGVIVVLSLGTEVVIRKTWFRRLLF